MKIIIDYESSWRNSFLDPNTSNNEPLPKNGRKFVGSMTNLKDVKNFQERKVTHDTVMGILNRLIGDQRKLYQSRNDDNYFFKDIDDIESNQVIFTDKAIETSEVTYIRNITGSTDQKSFTGAIKTNDPMFTSDYSSEFWGVLALDFEALCQFILTGKQVTSTIETNPASIIEKLEQLNKEKPVENTGIASDALQVLRNAH